LISSFLHRIIFVTDSILQLYGSNLYGGWSMIDDYCLWWMEFTVTAVRLY